MKRTPLAEADLQGVIAVPPLPRNHDTHRSINLDELNRLTRHIAAAGITRFMFGGNAFLYHLPLRDYEVLLDWMCDAPDDWWLLPAAGPSYGRLMDQAELLRPREFPAVMLLPSADPRDPTGMEQGIREFLDAAATRAIIYLKSEDAFGPDPARGLDVIGRLCADGQCVGIKYAIVRAHPAEDPFLKALLERVDSALVVSGIGERPAIVHMRDWGLPGFTTGSGCIAPLLSHAIFRECRDGRWDAAEEIRRRFLPLEDCRDAWNPARVLHHAVELAGIARTGPVLPFLSALDPERLGKVRAALPPLLEAAGPRA